MTTKKGTSVKAKDKKQEVLGPKEEENNAVVENKENLGSIEEDTAVNEGENVQKNDLEVLEKTESGVVSGPDLVNSAAAQKTKTDVFEEAEKENERLNLVYSIAKVCHQANKAFCESNGDFSQKDWDFAEDWQRQSAVSGVEFRLKYPEVGYEASHKAWMEEKIKEGWVYGEVKDVASKQHPCLVPFEELPPFQKKKDALFCSIVDALSK